MDGEAKKGFKEVLNSILVNSKRFQLQSHLPEWLKEESDYDFLDIPIMDTASKMLRSHKRNDIDWFRICKVNGVKVSGGKNHNT